MTALDRRSDEALLQRLQQAVQALPDAPAALQRSAIALWPAHGAPTLAGLAQAALRQLAAVLSFNSWAAPALAPGMRSLRSPTRHLLFSSLGRDIDLRITAAAEGFSLTGQILGPDETGQIELAPLPDNSPARHVGTLDALGEFRIDGVARGLYRLSLRLGDDQVTLPPIAVGDPLPDPQRGDGSGSGSGSDAESGSGH